MKSKITVDAVIRLRKLLPIPLYTKNLRITETFYLSYVRVKWSEISFRCIFASGISTLLKNGSELRILALAVVGQYMQLTWWKEGRSVML
jgi:hypothetical protein